MPSKVLTLFSEMKLKLNVFRYLLKEVMLDVEKVLEAFDAECCVAGQVGDVQFVDATGGHGVLEGDDRSQRQLGVPLGQLGTKDGIISDL